MSEYSDCMNEQQFKMKWLKKFTNPDFFAFCIETEETVKGFPDVMLVHKETKKAKFLEFKYTKTGKIKFQPAQPAFYKSHLEMEIAIVAYNAKTDEVFLIPKELLFEEGSKYKLKCGTATLD